MGLTRELSRGGQSPPLSWQPPVTAAPLHSFPCFYVCTVRGLEVRVRALGIGKLRDCQGTEGPGQVQWGLQASSGCSQFPGVALTSQLPP